MEKEKSALENFIGDLDKIIDEKIKGKSKQIDRMEATRTLLNAADHLLANNIIIQSKLRDGTLREGICGSSKLEETFEKEKKERAVIDLVQQGGTMLGIGLLGYTYIMERVGIRFRNMAGTSAGAINALLVASLPESIYQERSLFNDKREAVKSEMLAYLVANENFIKFLDRQGLIGQIQRVLIKNIKLSYNILRVMKFAFPALLFILSFLIYRFLHLYLYNSSNNFSENQINIYSYITGTLSIALVLLIVVVLALGILKKNMGLNPGIVPYEWLKSILATPYIAINTTEDLMQRRKDIPTPTYTPPLNCAQESFKDPRLVFISANLTHNRIVKFPENSSDYWNKQYYGKVSPAAFVRASMSLPFIFYTFIPDDHHVQAVPSTTTDTVDMRARFVDGGMLSNFPIREFHLPFPLEPRYPTFGVLLGSPVPEPGKDTQAIKEKFFSLSVFKYVVSFISTFRNFYDADFLRSHKEFHMLVKSVNTDRFNSLDFDMPFNTKVDLFKEGAKTALEQLEQFDWQTYQRCKWSTSPDFEAENGSRNICYDFSNTKDK